MGRGSKRNKPKQELIGPQLWVVRGRRNEVIGRITASTSVDISDDDIRRAFKVSDNHGVDVWGDGTSLITCWLSANRYRLGTIARRVL